MVAVKKPSKYITEEQAWAIFDQQARETLGISGREFVAAWQAGKIENPDQPEIIDLALLIPGAR